MERGTKIINKKKSTTNTGTRQATKEAKQKVAEHLEYMENPHITDIIALIQPLYDFDVRDLIEKELKRKARYIMSTFKDSNKVRIYFSDNDGVYINVDKTQDLVELSKVNRQLSVKYSGLNAAIKKVQGKIRKIVDKFRKNKHRRA